MTTNTNTHTNTETPQKTIGVTVRLPVELADALKNYAFVTDTSGNEVIKRALIEYLRVNGRTDMVRDAFEKVLTRHAVAFDKLADL
jgi:predicted transcriptional regulator